MPGLSGVETQVLTAIPRGRDNARTAAEIVEEVDVEKRDPTSYQLRQVIKTLIVDHEKPIGSCTDGYFMIETNVELEDCLDDLRQRKRGIQQRIRALRNAYTTDNDPQQSLF